MRLLGFMIDSNFDVEFAGIKCVLLSINPSLVLVRLSTKESTQLPALGCGLNRKCVEQDGTRLKSLLFPLCFIGKRDDEKEKKMLERLQTRQGQASVFKGELSEGA